MAETIGLAERVGRRKGILVGLSGELDLQCLPELRTTLSAALESRRSVWVDLSGITFMDALCLRELAVQYQLHPDRLVLWRPSPEVRLAAAICEAEDWVRFHPDRAAAPRLPSRLGQTAVAEGATAEPAGHPSGVIRSLRASLADPQRAAAGESTAVRRGR